MIYVIGKSQSNANWYIALNKYYIWYVIPELILFHGLLVLFDTLSIIFKLGEYIANSFGKNEDN